MANWMAGSMARFISSSVILPSWRRFTRSMIHRGRGSEPMPMVGKRWDLLMGLLFFRCDAQGSGVTAAGGPVVCGNIGAAQFCLVGEAEWVKPFILNFVLV